MDKRRHFKNDKNYEHLAVDVIFFLNKTLASYQLADKNDKSFVPLPFVSQPAIKCGAKIQVLELKRVAQLFS